MRTIYLEVIVCKIGLFVLGLGTWERSDRVKYRDPKQTRQFYTMNGKKCKVIIIIHS